MSLDETVLQKFLTNEGYISKADFIKLGQDMKLLDFGGAMGDKRKLATPKKERRIGETDVDGNVSCSLVGYG